MAALKRPALRLTRLERLLLVRRHRLLGNCEQHRDHHVVAGDRGEVDDLLIIEELPGARIGFVADLPGCGVSDGSQSGAEFILSSRFFC
ncbi:hypothetical protein ABIB06_007896 [Bradyrhizobium sp. LB8.2]|uniref:hypothetical protein n=1 Tax=unclassified Bradyrhizobium TaxID=2631580 RepID=UPI003392F23B